MICAVVKGPTILAVHQQISDVLPYADLIELRLDLFEKIEEAALKKLRMDFSIPMIFTVRSENQGGGFKGSYEEQMEMLLSLLHLQPEYLDLESQLPLGFFEEIAYRYPSIKLICSHHNFKNTPSDLDSIYWALKQKPAYFYKLAVMAENSSEALRLLAWVKKQDNKLIVISMGEFGQISRILAPVVGIPITYASVHEQSETAPGQIPAKVLNEIYGYHLLNSSTKIYGLIGGIVDNSMSHITHNALMQEAHLDAVYLKMSVPPTELSRFLSLAKQLDFSGMSVTMPLKEDVVSCLDEVHAEAKAIGAVNTLCFEGNRIIGFNTDGIGALKAILRQVEVSKKKVVILGAGGAAKAVAFETCRRGAYVTILNRHVAKAKQLAYSLKCVGGSLDMMSQCFDEGYDLLINCTPLAMPIDSRYILSSAVVMDIKTKPKEPLFLQEAKKKGSRLIWGYQMFVEQAVKQFDLWFKGKVSEETSREKIESQLEAILETQVVP